MNLLRSIFGQPALSDSPQAQIQQTLDCYSIVGSLYRILNSDRQPIFSECYIKFEHFGTSKDHSPYQISFFSEHNQLQKSFSFPIHSRMGLVSFVCPSSLLTSGASPRACFEWVPEANNNQLIVGCTVPLEHKIYFKDIFCQVIKTAAYYELRKDDSARQSLKSHHHLQFCNDLLAPPVYEDQRQMRQETRKSEQQAIEQVLYEQSQLDETRMACTGSMYFIYDQTRALKLKHAVLVIRGKSSQRHYQIQIFDSQGFMVLSRKITTEMNYEINLSQSYLKWFEPEYEGRVVEIIFDKYDSPINIRFAFQQCLYEMATGKNITDVIEEEEARFLNGIEDIPIQQPQVKVSIVNSKVVLEYSDSTHNTTGFVTPPKQQFEIEPEIVPSVPKFPLNLDKSTTKAAAVSVPSNLTNSLQKYSSNRTFCQAKNTFRTISTQDEVLRILRVAESGKTFQTIHESKLITEEQQSIIPQKMLTFNVDNTLLIHSKEKNTVYTYDLNKSKVSSSFDAQPYQNPPIVDLFYEKKLADLSIAEKFIAITSKSTFIVDPRTEKPFHETMHFKKDPGFCKTVTTSKGNIAVGSRNGDIRLYTEKPHANLGSKYPGFGDPVLHLDTTKDQKWLLATYKTYLLLLPTFVNTIPENEDENPRPASLFTNRLPIVDRPRPRRLNIKVEHLNFLKIKELSLINARFDETRDAQEKFIVSGFQDYVVVWSLNQVIRGNAEYTFSKTDDYLKQAQFKWDDNRRLIMASRSSPLKIETHNSR